MDQNEERNTPTGEERRGLSWAAMMALVLLTLVIATVLAYWIVVHNSPGGQ